MFDTFLNNSKITRSFAARISGVVLTVAAICLVLSVASSQTQPSSKATPDNDDNVSVVSEELTEGEVLLRAVDGVTDSLLAQSLRKMVEQVQSAGAGGGEIDDQMVLEVRGVCLNARTVYLDGNLHLMKYGDASFREVRTLIVKTFTLALDKFSWIEELEVEDRDLELSLESLQKKRDYFDSERPFKVVEGLTK